MEVIPTTKENQMFKTNEFNYKLDFNRPGIIVLEMTKKSKRNTRIRKVAPFAIATAAIYGVAAVAREYQLRTNVAVPDQETPTES